MKIILLVIMIISSIYAQNNKIKIIAHHPNAGIAIICVDGYKIIKTTGDRTSNILQLRDSNNKPIKCKLKQSKK